MTTTTEAEAVDMAYALGLVELNCRELTESLKHIVQALEMPAGHARLSDTLAERARYVCMIARDAIDNWGMVQGFPG